MEEEVDLRKYLAALFRRWRIILLTPFVLALVALVILRYPPFEAVSSVAIVKWQEDLTLDPNFRTRSEIDVGGGAATTRADSRRNSLVSLVTSNTLVERVIATLGDRLPANDRQPDVLLSKVSGQLAPSSDLILIRVRHSDRQLAAAIATTWAHEYERYVNNIYGSKPALSSAISLELEQSQRAYQQKQQEVERFVADSRIDKLTRQITMTEQLARDMQDEVRNTLGTVARQHLRLRTNQIVQYLTIQSNAASTVISKELELRTAILADRYVERAQLERLIGTAQTFRAQVAAGGEASAQSSELALLLLKAQIFTDRKALPTGLQVTLEHPSAPRSQAEYLADLDALIKVIEQRRTEIVTATEQAARDLLVGVAPPAGLQQDAHPLQQAATEQLTKLLNFDEPSLLMPEIESSALAAKLDEQIAKLAVLRGSLEHELARKRQLFEQRDLAWATYTIVARKQAEVEVASTVQGGEVRMVDPAIPSERRSYSIFKRVLLAALLGLLLGPILALLVDLTLGLQPRVRLWGNPNAPWNRGLRWVLNEPVRLNEAHSRPAASGD
jgi:capsular polysaccharide biosynthesis protein